MSKVDNTFSDSIVADLLVADATALNAKIAGLDADSAALARADGDAVGPQSMSTSRLIKIRELAES